MNLSNDLRRASSQHISRRWFLRDCGVGLAGIALAQLLQRDARAGTVHRGTRRIPSRPTRLSSRRRPNE